MIVDRYRWLRRIEQLDPVADHQQIYRISAGHEFPWDYQRALEFALFRTYCVPSISALLEATGEFRDRPQQRYDDTALLMAELAAHGYDSPRGKESLRVINRIHGRYTIDNDDLRYVLSTFIYDPIDWIDRFGWRPLSEPERAAGFLFYREVGVRMGIKELPTDAGEFRRFKLDYERLLFRRTDDTVRVGRYTLDLFCGWYPAPLRPAAAVAVRALLDPPMLTAFDLPAAPGWVTTGLHAALRGRAAVERRLPPRRVSMLATGKRNRTYPGYPGGRSPADLGAPAPPADLDPRWLAPRRPNP